MQKMNLNLRNFESCGYVYAYKFRNRFYIGITGTSNYTGTSSFYGRLGTHLKKRGNTYSFFWNKLFSDGVLTKGTLEVFWKKVPAGTTARTIEKNLINIIPEARLHNTKKFYSTAFPVNNKEDEFSLSFLTNLLAA